MSSGAKEKDLIAQDSMWSLREQVALVIGGSRGIGLAISRSLAAAGAQVVVASRSVESVDAACRQISDDGGRATAAVVDVGSIDQVERLVGETIQRHGRIDVLVNNAGINPIYNRPEQLGPDDWDQIMGVNLKGAFFACRAAGKQMIAQRNGRIINITSVTGLRGTLRGLPYTAAKAGMHAMTQTLAADWSEHGIRVNAVAPGFVETDLTSGFRGNPALYEACLDKIPLGRRFARPQEMTGIVHYLACEASSYVTGQVFVVDGGYSSIR